MAYILLAEDDTLQADTMRQCLAEQGHQVRVVSDGQQLVARTRETSPDAIVLDLRMPVCSGIEALEQLRAIYGGPLVPVIVVTAALDTGSLLDALRGGADDYLRKPFHPRELVHRVSRLLVARPCRRAGAGPGL